MIKLTQSNTDPGNCWQTAVACILEVDAEALPPQHEIEALPEVVLDEVLGGWGMYQNALNAYLSKHHGILYSEIYRYQFSAVRPVRPYHLMNGPTIRTEGHAKAGRRNINHCVVGHRGEPVWDVHPSRAGLLECHSWGVLGDVHQGYTEGWIKSINAEDPVRAAGAALVVGCICPACGLETLRERARAVVAAKGA